MLYSNYVIIYYQLPSGRCPVKNYLDQFKENESAEIRYSINLVAKYHGVPPPPYSKHIKNKIWELRVKFNKNQHRILYFITKTQGVVLLTAFQKKTTKTPQSEIIKATKYYFDYLSNI